MLDELARVKGVGAVTIFGAGQYAMRVWMNPRSWRREELPRMTSSVWSNLQSLQVPPARSERHRRRRGRTSNIRSISKASLDEAAEFENIVVKVGARQRRTNHTDPGIARVELGAQTYSQAFELDGRPAAGIAISLLPDANAVAAKRVKAKMDELAKSFPQGFRYSLPTTRRNSSAPRSTRSIETLIEAGILVLIVILVFLQDWRAMLVPATTVPVTIIGAFAAIAASVSASTPTLFAIVLAIGIVVDDAIVIVEGVARYVEQGVPGRDAASKAMDD